MKQKSCFLFALALCLAFAAQANAQTILAYTLTDKGKYYMSPAQLEDYNTYVDALYFPASNTFDGSTDASSTLRSVERQYASGLKTTQQFLSELDRMARMIELEKGQ